LASASGSRILLIMSRFAALQQRPRRHVQASSDRRERVERDVELATLDRPKELRSMPA